MAIPIYVEFNKLITETLTLTDTIYIVIIKNPIRGNMFPFGGEYAKTKIAQMTKPRHTLIKLELI